MLLMEKAWEEEVRIVKQNSIETEVWKHESVTLEEIVSDFQINFQTNLKAELDQCKLVLETSNEKIQQIEDDLRKERVSTSGFRFCNHFIEAAITWVPKHI